MVAVLAKQLNKCQHFWDTPVNVGIITPAIADIAARCESIGYNCEFGLIQRHIGIEPISLLRWAGSDLPRLVEALKSGFAGLMETATGQDHGCWRLICGRYGIVFHTDHRPAEMTVEQAAETDRPRLRWLADKLLADIGDGDRMLVYSNPSLRSATDALPLLRAIQDIGRATLMVVCADPERSGSAEHVADSMIAGYVRRLTTFGMAIEAEQEPWEAMLPKAFALWQSR